MMNIFNKIRKKVIDRSEYMKNFIIKITGFIKSYMWILELGIALFAIFIAYPQYKDFIDKNTTPNFNGQWKVEFQTLESSYNPYIGDKNTYNMFFIGDKNEYTSKGERVQINGEDILLVDNRDRIEFKLFIKENKIYGLYDLFGVRKTDGNFEVNILEGEESFEGTFVGNAANSKGVVKGFKIN